MSQPTISQPQSEPAPHLMGELFKGVGIYIHVTRDAAERKENLELSNFLKAHGAEIFSGPDDHRVTHVLVNGDDPKKGQYSRSQDITKSDHTLPEDRTKWTIWHMLRFFGRPRSLDGHRIGGCGKHILRRQWAYESLAQGSLVPLYRHEIHGHLRVRIKRTSQRRPHARDSSNPVLPAVSLHDETLSHGPQNAPPAAETQRPSLPTSSSGARKALGPSHEPCMLPPRSESKAGIGKLYPDARSRASPTPDHAPASHLTLAKSLSRVVAPSLGPQISPQEDDDFFIILESDPAADKGTSNVSRKRPRGDHPLEADTSRVTSHTSHAAAKLSARNGALADSSAPRSAAQTIVSREATPVSNKKRKLRVGSAERVKRRHIEARDITDFVYLHNLFGAGITFTNRGEYLRSLDSKHPRYQGSWVSLFDKYQGIYEAEFPLLLRFARRRGCGV